MAISSTSYTGECFSHIAAWAFGLLFGYKESGIKTKHSNISVGHQFYSPDRSSFFLGWLSPCTVVDKSAVTIVLHECSSTSWLLYDVLFFSSLSSLAKVLQCDPRFVPHCRNDKFLRESCLPVTADHLATNSDLFARHSLHDGSFSVLEVIPLVAFS